MHAASHKLGKTVVIEALKFSSYRWYLVIEVVSRYLQPYI